MFYGLSRAVATGLLGVAVAGCAARHQPIEPPQQPIDRNLRAELKQADRALREARLLDAEIQYRKLTKEHPTLPDVWLRLGNIYARQGQNDAAARVYTDGLSYRRNDGRLWYNLALVQLKQSVQTLEAASQAIDADSAYLPRVRRLHGALLSANTIATGINANPQSRAAPRPSAQRGVPAVARNRKTSGGADPRSGTGVAEEPEPEPLPTHAARAMNPIQNTTAATPARRSNSLGRPNSRNQTAQTQPRRSTKPAPLQTAPSEKMVPLSGSAASVKRSSGTTAPADTSDATLGTTTAKVAVADAGRASAGQVVSSGTGRASRDRAQRQSQPDESDDATLENASQSGEVADAPEPTANAQQPPDAQTKSVSAKMPTAESREALSVPDGVDDTDSLDETEDAPVSPSSSTAAVENPARKTRRAEAETAAETPASATGTTVTTPRPGQPSSPVNQPGQGAPAAQTAHQANNDASQSVATSSAGAVNQASASTDDESQPQRPQDGAASPASSNAAMGEPADRAAVASSGASDSAIRQPETADRSDRSEPEATDAGGAQPDIDTAAAADVERGAQTKNSVPEPVRQDADDAGPAPGMSSSSIVDTEQTQPSPAPNDRAGASEPNSRAGS